MVIGVMSCGFSANEVLRGNDVFAPARAEQAVEGLADRHLRLAAGPLGGVVVGLDIEVDRLHRLGGNRRERQQSKCEGDDGASCVVRHGNPPRTEQS